MAAWAILAGAIVIEVVATLALRAAQNHPAWYVLVVVGYLTAFLLLPQVLKRGIGVGVAYGIWGATGVALVALLGSLVFGDPLTPTMVAGIGLTIVGVLVVQLGSQRAAQSVAERSRS